MNLLCTPCSSAFPTVLCGDGRTMVYGGSVDECQRFHTDAQAFDEQITQWTVLGNATADELYPGCRDALETLFCAQQEVTGADAQTPSGCSDYRRHDHANVHRCLTFCPAIRDTCPVAAHQHCEERCRTSLAPAFCRVIEVVGLATSRYEDDTLDMMNLYRLEAEADVPLLRDGRPSYRSIPARRTSGSGRATKLDYYLYSTRRRGYSEWLLDTNDIEDDGAAAFASDANLEPYRINSDCARAGVEARPLLDASVPRPP